MLYCSPARIVYIQGVKSACIFLAACLALQALATEILPDLAGYKHSVSPFLDTYCLDCHDQDAKKDAVRLDTIDPDIVSGKDSVLWEEALDRMLIGEMPPPKKKSVPQPTDAERQMITDWIRRELQKHLVHKVGVPGRVVLRRLNRREYRNTMHDLLDVPEDFGLALTPDTSFGGFDNIGTAQELSPTHIREFLSTARRAIDLAIPDKPRPMSVHYKYTVQEKQPPEWMVALHGEKVNEELWPVIKDPKLPSRLRKRLPNQPDQWETVTKGAGVRMTGKWLKPQGALLHAAREVFKGNWGYYGVKLPYVPDDIDFVRLRIKAGGVAVNGGETKPIMSIHIFRKLYKHFEVDAPVDNPKWYEFVVSLRDLPPVVQKIKDDPRFHKQSNTDIVINNGYELPGVKPGHKWEAIPAGVEMPELAVFAVEFDINYRESWPPPQQVALLGNTSSIDPRARAESVLSRFMSRAFRRPVRTEELAGKLELFDRTYADSGSFVTAIKEPLVATLASPQFLFLSEDESVDEKSRRRLNGFELASRLSYFAWCTKPDNELLRAASDSSLLQPEVLRRQLTRLLKDPRADNFYRSFVTQWLHLGKLDEQMIEDRRWRCSYQLPNAMKDETVTFFKTLVQEDLNLMNLVHSDFALLNERMAFHYKIPGVYGNHFRKVTLKPEYRRGGVLTQASVMALTTDAMITSPIYRGVWVLEKILDKPPPPAPANVPPLEDAPTERLSLREQLRRHREDENCAACHRRIDPLGWPFEQYSILGEFNTQGWGPNWSEYHVTKWRKGKKHDETPDMHGVLPNGTRVEDVRDLQDALLRSNHEDIVRSVAKHLMLYALGRPLDISDEAVLADIVSQVTQQEFSTRALVEAVVTSRPFLEK